jgi:hypothetical protein
MIRATELPYSVYTNTIMEQLEKLTNEDENYGIDRVVDHTKETADIRIYLSKTANPSVMMKKLYKDTSLENWFSINMIMLDHGRFPKVFGWRSACNAYIEHIRECKTRELQYEYDPLRHQYGYNSNTGEFRAYDDKLSDWFCIQCASVSLETGETVMADLEYTAQNTTRKYEGLMFVVKKISSEGYVWLWNDAKKIGVVVRLLE